MNKKLPFIARVATIAGLAIGAFFLLSLGKAGTWAASGGSSGTGVWTAPTATAPNGNIDAPITVGGGTAGNTYVQTKTGTLILSSLILNPNSGGAVPNGQVLTSSGSNGTAVWAAAGGSGSSGSDTNILKFTIDNLTNNNYSCVAAKDLTSYCNSPMGCVIETFESTPYNSPFPIPSIHYRHNLSYLTYEHNPTGLGLGFSFFGLLDNSMYTSSQTGTAGTSYTYSGISVGSWSTMYNFAFANGGTCNGSGTGYTNPYMWDFKVMGNTKTEFWIYPRSTSAGGGSSGGTSDLYPHINYQNKNPSALPLGSSDPTTVDPWPYSVFYGGSANSGPMYCTSMNAFEYCTERNTLFSNMQCNGTETTSLANFAGPGGAWSSVNMSGAPMKKITQVTCATAYNGDINTTPQ